MRISLLRSNFIHWIFVIGTAILLGAMAIESPHRNWDIVGYVASAYHYDGMRGAELSEKTFNALQTEMDPGTYQSVISGPYRATVFQDPDSLRQQLPFYSIRYLYVQMIRGLKILGTPYPKGTYITSALASSLSVIVLAYICMSLQISLTTVPLIVISSGFFDIARLSTPDSLALLFSLFLLLSLIKRSKLSFLISVVLPLVRTDLVFLSLLALLYNYLNGEKIRSAFAATLTLCIYLAINLLMGHYGWSTMMTFTFIGPNPYPETLINSTSFNAYLAALPMLAKNLISSQQFFFYWVGAYCFFMADNDWKKNRNMQILFLIPFAYFVLHLILFPAYFERFFVFSSCALSIWILYSINKALSR